MSFVYIKMANLRCQTTVVNGVYIGRRPHSVGSPSSSAAVNGGGSSAQASGNPNAQPSYVQDQYKRWRTFDVKPALAEASETETELLPTKEARRIKEDKVMEAVTTKRVPKAAAPIRHKPPPPTDAIGWKERGNELFRRSDLAGAKAAYTRYITFTAAVTA